MEAAQEQKNPLHDMEDEQLVSALILADRKHIETGSDADIEKFRTLRKEVMYRLHCARPLLNWTKPTRREQ